LTLNIFRLEDAVGDAIGSGQEILASPFETGAGTAMEKQQMSACKIHEKRFTCKNQALDRAKNLHAEQVQQAIVLLDLLSRDLFLGKIADGLEQLLADTALARRLLLGVAAIRQETSVMCGNPFSDPRLENLHAKVVRQLVEFLLVFGPDGGFHGWADD
jgi:hypothetical protein